MTEVKAPLAGNIWKIECRTGDQVEQDDVLIILDSMKMEIPIQAPVAGKIEAIQVQMTDVVTEGQVLVTIADV